MSKCKVLIFVEGGCVIDVLTNKEIDVFIKDFDEPDHAENDEEFKKLLKEMEGVVNYVH